MSTGKGVGDETLYARNPTINNLVISCRLIEGYMTPSPAQIFKLVLLPDMFSPYTSHWTGFLD